MIVKEEQTRGLHFIIFKVAVIVRITVKHSLVRAKTRKLTNSKARQMEKMETARDWLSGHLNKAGAV